MCWLRVEVLMCYVSTPPRTECPLAHVRFNTHTIHGLCTSATNWNTPCREFHCYDESVREIQSRLSKIPSSALAQADWLNHCLSLKPCPTSRWFRLPPPHRTILSQRQETSTTASCILSSFDCCLSTTRIRPSVPQQFCVRWSRSRPGPSTSHTVKYEVLYRLRWFQPPISSCRSRQPRTPILALVFRVQPQVPTPRVHRRRQIPPAKLLRGSFKCFSASAPWQLWNCPSFDISVPKASRSSGHPFIASAPAVKSSASKAHQPASDLTTLLPLLLPLPPLLSLPFCCNCSEAATCWFSSADILGAPPSLNCYCADTSITMHATDDLSSSLPHPLPSPLIFMIPPTRINVSIWNHAFPFVKWSARFCPDLVTSFTLPDLVTSFSHKYLNSSCRVFPRPLSRHYRFGSVGVSPDPHVGGQPMQRLQTTSLSSRLILDGEGRHHFSVGEKKVDWCFSFNFRIFFASFHAASLANALASLSLPETDLGKFYRAMDLGLYCWLGATRLWCIEIIGLVSAWLSSSVKSMKISAAPCLEIHNPIAVSPSI